MKTAVRVAGVVLLAESVVVFWYFGTTLNLLRNLGVLMHGPTLALASILFPLGGLITGAIALLWPPTTSVARIALLIAIASWFFGLWTLVRAVVFMVHASPLAGEARATWW